MNRGKNICKQLKNVRRCIAEENGIPLEIEECTYKGDCSGTCPRCEAEVRFLENELANRIRLGKVATIAGLAVGLATTTTQAQAPANTSAIPDTSKRIEKPLAGEVMAPDPLFYQVDEPPTFPGGDNKMIDFIRKNLRYPSIAAEQGIGGLVYVTFIVETDGTILNPYVSKGIGGGCDEEALRIVGLMPKWNPGKIKGMPVRVQYELPIYFSIQSSRGQKMGKVPMEPKKNEGPSREPENWEKIIVR